MAIRKYKPTTPGRRGASGSDFSEITRDRPESLLIARDLLGHARLETTNRYYMQAKSIEAGLEYAAAVDRLRKDGVRLVSDQIKTGAGGHQYVFVHPSSTGGVLLELVEG